MANLVVKRGTMDFDSQERLNSLRERSLICQAPRVLKLIGGASK